jgi:hypothetical protein
MVWISLLKGRYGGLEEERRKKIFFANGIVGNIFRSFRWIFDIYGDTECDICVFSSESSWKTSDERSMYSGSLKWLVLSGPW